MTEPRDAAAPGLDEQERNDTGDDDRRGPPGTRQSSEDQRAARAVSNDISTLTTQSAFVGNDLKYASFYINGREGKSVSTLDITGLAETSSRRFAGGETERKEIAGALRARRAVTLVGMPGTGKLTLASVALHEHGSRPVLRIDGAIPPDELHDAIRSALCSGYDTGVLVDSVPARRTSAAWQMQLESLLAVIRDGGKRGLVLTCDAAPDSVPSGQSSTMTLSTQGPDPAEVARVHLEYLGKEGQSGRVAAALKDFTYPPSARTVVELVNRAVQQLDSTPEQLADAFQFHTITAKIDDWVNDNSSRWAFARLAVALCCSPTSRSVIDTQAEQLMAVIRGIATASSNAESALDPVPVTILDGLFDLRTRPIETHFGLVSENAYFLRNPQVLPAAIGHLWRTADETFRGAFLRWIRATPRSVHRTVRIGGAVTAGVLFSQEPLRLEREILRAWSCSDVATDRSSAGLATGIPVMTGGEAASARRLVNTWASGNNLAQQEAAVLAYGGALGSHDLAAGAPIQLVALCRRAPQLKDLALHCLASLTSGSGNADTARVLTLQVLTECCQDPRLSVLAFESVAYIGIELTSSYEGPPPALQALFTDDGRQSLTLVAELVCRALANAAGRASAVSLLRDFFRAAGHGQLSETDLRGFLVALARTRTEPANDLRAMNSLARALRILAKDGDKAVARTATRLLEGT